MDKKIHTPRIPLFRGLEETQSIENYVYGSDDLTAQLGDTFCSALDRYMREIDVSRKMLSNLTGIALSTISRYLSAKRQIKYEYLCAICIALRLHPCRQRHLFSLRRYSMPCEKNYAEHSDHIIRMFLDGCAFVEGYTLSACNEQLIAHDTPALTKLNSETEDSK